MNNDAKNLCFRIIYNLIVKEFRSEYMHKNRIFNPKTFRRRAIKSSLIQSQGGGSVCLAELVAEGYIVETRSKDYTYEMYQITEKFVRECYRRTKMKISLNVDKLPDKTYPEKFKKSQAEEVERIEIEEEIGLNGVEALKIKFQNREELTLAQAKELYEHMKKKAKGELEIETLRKEIFALI